METTPGDVGVAVVDDDPEPHAARTVAAATTPSGCPHLTMTLVPLDVASVGGVPRRRPREH